MQELSTRPPPRLLVPPLGRVPSVAAQPSAARGDSVPRPSLTGVAALLLRIPASRTYPLDSLAVADAPTFASYMAATRLGMPSVFDMGMAPSRRRAMRATLLRRERLVLALRPEEAADLSTVDPASLAARSGVRHASAEEAVAAVVSLAALRRSAELLCAARASLQAAVAAGPSAEGAIDELEMWAPLADWDLNSFLHYVRAVRAAEQGSSLWELLAAGVQPPPQVAPPPPPADVIEVTAAVLAALTRGERARPLLLLAPRRLGEVARAVRLAPVEVTDVLAHLLDLKRRPYELAAQLLTDVQQQQQQQQSTGDSAVTGEAAGRDSGPTLGVAPPALGAALSEQFSQQQHKRQRRDDGAAAAGAPDSAAPPARVAGGSTPNATARGERSTRLQGSIAGGGGQLPTLDDYLAGLDRARAAAAGDARPDSGGRAGRLLMLRHRRIIQRLHPREKRQVELAVRSLAQQAAEAAEPEQVLQAALSLPGMGLSDAQQAAVGSRCSCSVHELQQLLQAYAAFCLVNSMATITD